MRLCDELLRDLSLLGHHERMRRMVDIGRGKHNTKPAAAVLGEMAAGTPYERRLAAQACHGHPLRQLFERRWWLSLRAESDTRPFEDF